MSVLEKIERALISGVDGVRLSEPTMRRKARSGCAVESATTVWPGQAGIVRSPRTGTDHPRHPRHPRSRVSTTHPADRPALTHRRPAGRRDSDDGPARARVPHRRSSGAAAPIVRRATFRPARPAAVRKRYCRFHVISGFVQLAQLYPGDAGVAQQFHPHGWDGRVRAKAERVRGARARQRAGVVAPCHLN